MAKTVFIGCRLPHGIILDHPLDPTKRVELAGLNKAAIIGATHAVTEVDAEFWELWLTTNKTFPALLNGAIFEAKSAADASAKAHDFIKERTGFEPMPTEADGVKPVDKD